MQTTGDPLALLDYSELRGKAEVKCFSYYY